MMLPRIVTAANKPLVLRTIPSTGEQVPVVGMGSWLTFDVGTSQSRKQQMGKVLKAFYEAGGRVIDSSPMYGTSEEVIGSLAQAMHLDRLWVATKVWTDGKERGRSQIRRSGEYFNGNIRLHQVHNLRDVDKHYQTLRDKQEQGKLKYIGVTHYLNHAHDDLQRIITRYPLDFVQVNFNIGNPSAEDRLLPFAADKGVAVIINRPYQTGRLIRKVTGKPLPSWSAAWEIDSWAQFMLKFIISHPAVTCAIPATTRVDHAIENVNSGRGEFPSEEVRRKMLSTFNNL